jgi:hypothetical protein
MSDSQFSGGALYYPFSRCMDEAALKQMLLLFESVTFIDPVTDEDHRRDLFEDIEMVDVRFRKYRDVALMMPWLCKQGIVRIIEPEEVKAFSSDLTTASCLSDITDTTWVKAADPRSSGLPIQTAGPNSTPIWNVFRPKIPEKLINILHSNTRLKKAHLHMNGGDMHAWELSYAAGSAIGINTHLAAAEELGLAPVTDSHLHHNLVALKLARASKLGQIAVGKAASQYARDTVQKLIGQILERKHLENLELDKVLEFRSRSAPPKA